MSSEEADFSGLNDVRDVIAPLQKQIAANIDQKGRSDFAGILIAHQKL
ncbi:cell division topological specificity factor MinE [Nitrobacter sp. Nb-311A]|nr:cell division topological specificity factor MinE [Nitrobacter sp. Nb-311A]